MSLTMRETHPRNAKERAVDEIRNYFQPMRKLQSIPENAALVLNSKKTKPSKKDKNNNNTGHTKTTVTKTTTNTSNHHCKGEINKKKDAPQSKSSKIRNIKTKHQDDDKDTESPIDAKRKKIADAAGIDSSKPTADKEKRDLQPSSSSSSRTPSSSTSSSNASSDEVVVILDNSIDSNCSLNEPSFANTTASTSKGNTSRPDRSHRAANYNFDALQTDDETDEEDNTPYAPQWSQFKNRFGHVIDQEDIDPDVIDEFFGCRAETVDLKAIFPNIVPIARRRSTAVWNTPPHYSSLPKY